MKTLTEQFAHGLLETGKPDTAHLLVPRWTFTRIIDAPGRRRPAGTWLPEQVIDRMITAVEAGDFYMICQDGLVTSELDAASIRWSAEDMIENRPARSRWHPAWKDRFAELVRKEPGD